MFKQEDLMGLKESVDWAYLLNMLGFQKINAQTRRCCCLIHGGTNPTAFSWTGNFFHCFSCLRSGDSIELVQLIKRFSFVEAVKYLSDLFGYGIRTISNFRKEVKNEEREIPEYIVKKISRQNFATIQIKEEIRNIEETQEMLTDILVSMRKDREKYANFCLSIENRLNDLDSDLRIWTYYLHKYDKN